MTQLNQPKDQLWELMEGYNDSIFESDEEEVLPELTESPEWFSTRYLPLVAESDEEYEAEPSWFIPIPAPPQNSPNDSPPCDEELKEIDEHYNKNIILAVMPLRREIEFTPIPLLLPNPIFEEIQSPIVREIEAEIVSDPIEADPIEVIPEIELDRYVITEIELAEIIYIKERYHGHTRL